MNVRNFADFKSFFFDNKTVKQTIFKNIFWLTIAEGAVKLSQIVLFIFIARTLGATEFGKFTFALAFVSMFVVLSQLGLPEIITREFSREKRSKREYIAILTLKILLSLGALILILVGSFFITPDPAVQKIIWILAAYIIIYSFGEIIFAFFRAYQKMEYEAGIKTLQALLLIGIGFFILFNFPSVENLSYGYLFAGFATLTFLLLFFHFKIYHLTISWNTDIWKKFLGFSWPLALTAIFGSVYVYIDSIMMGYWGQITETGWYNAAYKIVNVSLIPMIIISFSFYPILSKLFEVSKEKLQNIWNRHVEAMIILAIPLMIGGVTLASEIIDLVYGQSFKPSILALQILIFMAGFWFLCYPYSRILVISEQQKKIFNITFIGALINIILNLILIPRYSLYGAAVATVVTYGIVFFLTVLATKYYTPIIPINFKILITFITSLFAGLAMYLYISQLLIYHLNIILIITTGALIYFVSLLLLIKITKLINIKIL